MVANSIVTNACDVFNNGPVLLNQCDSVLEVSCHSFLLNHTESSYFFIVWVEGNRYSIVLQYIACQYYIETRMAGISSQDCVACTFTHSCKFCTQEGERGKHDIQIIKQQPKNIHIQYVTNMDMMGKQLKEKTHYTTLEKVLIKCSIIQMWLMIASLISVT